MSIIFIQAVGSRCLRREMGKERESDQSLLLYSDFNNKKMQE